MFSSDTQKYGVYFLAALALLCLIFFPPLGIVIAIAAAAMTALNWIDTKTGKWLDKKLK